MEILSPEVAEATKKKFSEENETETIGGAVPEEVFLDQVLKAAGS